MQKIQDLSGMRFGRLTVVKFLCRGGGQTKWECACDCGRTHIASASNLKRGHVRSCGCLSRELAAKRLLSHGEADTRLYSIWDGMKRRCKGTSGYKNKRLYCDRGISYCDEWESYENFRDWAFSNGYRDGLTIDRIDGNREYCPENCRWVNMKVQQNNRRNNHKVTHAGQTKTIGEWATEKGIPYDTLYNRLYIGWTMEKALSVPF